MFLIVLNRVEFTREGDYFSLVLCKVILIGRIDVSFSDVCWKLKIYNFICLIIDFNLLAHPFPPRLPPMQQFVFFRTVRVTVRICLLSIDSRNKKWTWQKCNTPIIITAFVMLSHDSPNFFIRSVAD